MIDRVLDGFVALGSMPTRDIIRLVVVFLLSASASAMADRGWFMNKDWFNRNPCLAITFHLVFGLVCLAAGAWCFSFFDKRAAYSTITVGIASLTGMLLWTIGDGQCVGVFTGGGDL
jgi:hypothetical protein